MHRIIVMFAAIVVLTLGYALVGGAQDQATPSPAGTATQEILCATPLTETTASPEIVVTAPTTAASPGGSDPGTPIGLIPCDPASPRATP